MLEAARRFSCVFLTTSGEGAARLNHQLSQAGIRAYHAVDTREAEVLLGITRAKVLLIDIDRTFEPWLEILQKLEESHPRVPKVVLTGRGPDVRSLILSKFALDVISKPTNLGDLFGALECAQSLALEINDPERVREREARVMAAIRSAATAAGPRSRRLALYPARRVCHDGQGDSCLVEIRLSSDPKATCRRMNYRRKPRTAARG